MLRHVPSVATAIALLSSIASAQFTIVLPNGFAATEANSSNAFPWGRGTAGSLEIQTMYDSSNLTAQGITYPILIQGLRYRANGNATSAGGTYAACSVDMASAATDAMAPSATFASNVGPNLTTVYSGPVTVSPVTAATPGTWAVNIPLQTNFLYDPTLGADLVIFSHIPPPAQSPITGNPGLQLDVQTTGSLSSRIFNSSTTVYPNVTGTIATSHGVVVELTYVPAAGLYPAFTATPTTGSSPLAVQFTDSSYSSDPGGVTAWLWDLDGDNVIDSTVQNPSFLYNACGTYNVSLSVIDASHPIATLTRTGYIVVDPIAANFTASATGGFAPHTVNFTDTSTGTVAAWLWDFDGDTVIDSTAQNPTWIYATPGQYTVSLTVLNACRTNTRTRTNFVIVLAPGASPASPELMQYQLNEVRGQEVGNSASTNTAPRQGTVNVANWWSDPARADFRGNEPGFGCIGYRATGAGSVDTGWPTSITGSFSISFWLKRDPASTISSPFGYPFGNGTFRAFTGSAGIFFAGSPIGQVTSGFTVHTTPGVWQHLAIVVDDNAGQALWYSNGVASTTVVTFLPNSFVYSGPNLAIGATSTTGGSPIGAHFHLDDFRFYTRALTQAELQVLALLPENAAAGASGLSCPGTLGVPVIGSAGGLPTPGNAAFAVTLSNAEDSRLAAIAFGIAPAAFGTLSLAPWLGAGCVLQNDSIGLNFLVTSGNAATQPLGIPPGTGFTGLHIYGQWAVLGTVGAATRMLDINIR